MGTNQFNLQVKYKGVGKSYTINLADILEIHEVELTKHFAEQASIFGHFSIQLAEADRLFGIAKMMAEQQYAEADSYYRDEHNEAEEKYTEPSIRAEIALDGDYQKALDKQRNAMHNVAVLKAVVNALKMKAEMLISMGAHLRQEYDMTGMTIREQSMDKEVDKVKQLLKKSD